MVMVVGGGNVTGLGSGVINGTSIASGTVTGSNLLDGTVATVDLAQPFTANGSVTAATGSPTAVNFHAIPSWVKRITIGFVGISTNSTGFHQIQFGTGTSASPSWTTSGYLTEFAGLTVTTGFKLNTGTAASNFSGVATFLLVDPASNAWAGTAAISDNTAATGAYYTAGSIVLSGPLTQARIYTSNGTDTFDAGYVNLFYE